MKPPVRDYYIPFGPRDVKLQRDTDTLAGKLTHADRARINKAWQRATKLGAMRVVQIEMRRDAKRGFQL